MPHIGFRDIVDILLIASMMYGFYQLLRRSHAANLFWGILMIVVAWFVVSLLKLDLTSALFDQIISVGALALIVIFQEEIRDLIYGLGSRFNLSGLGRLVMRRESKQAGQYVGQIALACSNMQKTKTGALIVVAGDVSLTDYLATGERIDSVISARLIENIFFKNTPLHDGALILSHGRLLGAACILPVSKNADIPQHYGLRHRAALGLTEKTDALAIIVSEETGKISVAQKGEIKEVSPNELTQIITSFVI